MEVLTGPERRRRWSAEEKLAMVRESFEPGKTVSMVARQHGINPNQLFHWRKLYQDGGCRRSVRRGSGAGLELSDALKQIRELQRMLGKKTMEVEILGGRGVWPSKKMDCALTLIAGGRPVKRSATSRCGALECNGKARTACGWQDGRAAETDDVDLVEEIRLFSRLAELWLPTRLGPVAK
jgi:transposase-like protein